MFISYRLQNQRDDIQAQALGNNKMSQRYPDDLLIPINDLRSEILIKNDLTYPEKIKLSNYVLGIIESTIKRIKENNKN
jgi:hypothetical protein